MQCFHCLANIRYPYHSLSNRFLNKPQSGNTYLGNTIELIDWSPLKKPIEELMANYYDVNEPKLAALTWMEAGQLSTVMQNKFETLVIDSDPHHFLFLKKSPTIGKTFLVKLSLGSKPDISSTLVRIKKFDEKAIHLKNIILSRGKRNYATASIYLLNK